MEIPKKHTWDGSQVVRKDSFFNWVRDNWEDMWYEGMIKIDLSQGEDGLSIRIPYTIIYEYIGKFRNDMAEILGMKTDCKRSWMYFQGKSVRSITFYPEEIDRWDLPEENRGFYFKEKQYSHRSALLQRVFSAWISIKPMVHGFGKLVPGSDGAIMRISAGYFRNREKNDIDHAIPKSEAEEGAEYKDYANQLSLYDIYGSTMRINGKPEWGFPIPVSLIDFHLRKGRWHLWNI